MFLTLNAALNFMALVHDTAKIDKGLLKNRRQLPTCGKN